MAVPTTSPSPAAARLPGTLLAVACLLSGCGDGGEDRGTDPPAVFEVIVEAASTTVAVGESVQLEAITRDESGSPLEGRTVEWASANAGIATVTETGLVTGQGAGEVEITATVEAV